MLKAAVEKRELGMVPVPGTGSRMLLWAPSASSAEIEVEDKGSFPLTRKEYGYWEGTLPGVGVGDRYMVAIDGGKKIPDPASLLQPEGVHGASEISDPLIFRDTADTWKGIDTGKLVIYELHTGTFSPKGDFNGISEKLPYLADLGINAIELMPVAQFPGSRNWGYDGVCPFAVQESYGGPEQLARLVRNCHDRGIAVILDVVYNHLGPEGNYLAVTGPYFTEKYKTPWGSAVNFDDAWCDGVRRYFIENALMWLRDYGIDGLRLDAVHAIKDFSAVHFLAELAGYVQELNRQSGRNHFLIAESDLNDTRFITPAGEKGIGLDCQWCDEFHHALHARLTGERDGYYSDFTGTEHLVRSYNNAYVFDRRYSPYRKRIYGSTTDGIPGSRFVVFTQNHDQVGNRMLGERLSSLVGFESLKLAAGAMFVSPFIPMLFMGEEYGEEAPFLYFTSHGDKELIRAVREGRKKEFADFQGHSDAPDPDDEETFARSMLSWDYNDEKKKQLLAFYRKLIDLKKTHPALSPGYRNGPIATEAAGGDAICLRIPFDGITADALDEMHGRGYIDTKDPGAGTGGMLTVILNFSEERIELPVADGSTAGSIILLYSAHTRWGGPVNEFASLVNKSCLTLDPRSILILSDSKDMNKS